MSIGWWNNNSVRKIQMKTIKKLFSCSMKNAILKTPPTFTAASLQNSQIGASLLWNQLRKSRKDLTPSPIFPSDVEQSHWSRTNSSRVLSFWVMVKFLNAVGIWDEYPCDCDSIPFRIWKVSSSCSYTNDKSD